jgi:hypothetical protein
MVVWTEQCLRHDDGQQWVSYLCIVFSGLDYKYIV